MLIQSLMRPNGRLRMHDHTVQNIEDHLTHLSNSAIITTVTPLTAYKYEGDFHGLLDTLGVTIQHHYAITRLNGLNTPQDYDGVATDIVMLSELTYLDRILAM